MISIPSRKVKRERSYEPLPVERDLFSEMPENGVSGISPWIVNGITPGLKHLVGNKITFQMICVPSAKVERERREKILRVVSKVGFRGRLPHWNASF